MNAADLLARSQRIAHLLESSRRIIGAVVFVAATLGLAYCAGRASGGNDATLTGELHRADSTIANAAKLAHVAALRVDSARRVATAAKADGVTAVARAAGFRHVLQVKNDTTLLVTRSIDSMPIVAIVPHEVIDEEEADSTAIEQLTVALAADDSLIHALDDRHTVDAMQLEAATGKIAVLEKRKAPRFGLRSGLAAGATLALLIVHFVR